MKKYSLMLAVLTCSLPILGQTNQQIYFETQCINDTIVASKYIPIKDFKILEYLKEGRAKDRNILGLEYLSLKLVLVNCDWKSPAFFVKMIDNEGETYLNGFLLSLDDATLYISFKGGRNTNCEGLARNIDLLNDGETDLIHSIMLLDGELKSIYTIRYDESSPLYVVMSQYDESKNFHRAVVGSSKRLLTLQLDSKLNILHTLTLSMIKALRLDYFTLMDPHVNLGYANYLWMFNDTYLNSLLHPRG